MAKFEIKHRGQVSNGILIFDFAERWNSQLKTLEGKRFCIVIEEEHRKVTHSQHGYYRGGILPFLSQTETFAGWEEDEIHERHFAPLFLSYKKVIHHTDGSITEKPCVHSTAGLSVQEMKTFIEKVIMWCALEGIEVPDSKDFYIQKYREVNKT